MIQRILLLLLLIGLIGCAEGQKPNPLPRAAVGSKIDNVDQVNPVRKEAIK